MWRKNKRISEMSKNQKWKIAQKEAECPYHH
jgi:hypothetical protein